MRDIIIYGAGGFGRETALMIRQINEREQAWNILGFCDDNVKRGVSVGGLPVIGGLSHLNELSADVSIALAVADPSSRRKLKDRITNPRINYPVLVHPSVLQGEFERNRIDEGAIVAAGNILTTDVHIGPFVIINLSCTIGHDVLIDGFSSIMPGCSVSGAVKIGSGVLVGTGAKILQNLIVGDKSRVGAGAVVTKNVEPGTTVMGVPAKVVHRE